MTIVIHSTAKLPIAHAALQAHVEGYLADSGKVTGGASAAEGWALNVEVFSRWTADEVEQFARFLRRMQVPPYTSLDCGFAKGVKKSFAVPAEV